MPSSQRTARFVISLDEQGAKIEDFAKRWDKVTDRAGKRASGFGDVIRTGIGTAIGFVTANAIPRMGDAISNLVDRSSRINSLETAFRSLSSSVGLSADAMRVGLRDATHGLISDFELMEKTNNALTLGIVQSEDQWTTLAGAGVKLGRAVGLDATQAIESLTVGLGRQSKLVLDNLGIIVDSEGAYQSYAEALGKTVSQLTEAERKTAFLEEAQRAILEAAERTGDAQLKLGDRIQQARIRLQNWIDSMIGVINQSPHMQAVLDELARVFSEQGGILDTLTEKFRENLPAAIQFTLDAFVLLSRGFATVRFVAAQSINAMVIGFQSLVGVLVETLEIFEKIRLAHAIATSDMSAVASATANVTTLQQFSNAVWDTAADRLLDMEDAAREAIDGQVDLELAVRAFQDRLNELSTTEDTVAAPAARNLADALGEVNEQLLDGAPAAVDFRDAVGELPPVLEEVEEDTQEATTETDNWNRSLGSVFDTINTGRQWLDNLISSIGNFIGSLLNGQGPLAAFQNSLAGIGGLLGSLGGTGGGIAGNVLGSLGAGGPLSGLIGAGGAAGGAATGAGFAGVSAGTTFGGGGALGGLGPLAGLLTNPITGIVAGGAVGVGLLIKALTKSREEARTERQEGIFGSFQVPDSVLTSLRDLSIEATKAGRDLPDTIASIVGFDDVLRSVGITTEGQFAFAMQKGDEAVQRLKQGVLSGAEAAEFFGTNSLRIMQDAAVAMGDAAVAEFDHMIEKAMEAGIVIPEEFQKAMEETAKTTEDEMNKVLSVLGRQEQDLRRQLAGARGRERIEIEKALEDLHTQIAEYERAAARAMQNAVDNSAIAGGSIARNLAGGFGGATASNHLYRPGQSGGVTRIAVEVRGDGESRLMDEIARSIHVRSDRRRSAGGI